VLPADSGEIQFEGVPMLDTRASRRTLRGIARTFQNIRLFPHLTVLETVMIGEHCRLFPSVWQSFRAAALQLPFVEASQERAMRTSALTLLEFFGLADKRDAKASDLPMATSVALRWHARSRPSLDCCCSTSRPPA
jgi:ABC-type branched-chain amino acid transport systems, ATPase component